MKKKTTKASKLARRIKKDIGEVRRDLDTTAKLIDAAQTTLRNEGDIKVEELFAVLEPHRDRVKADDASWERDRQLYCKSKDQLDIYSAKLDGYAAAIEAFEARCEALGIPRADVEAFRDDVIQCSIWNGRHGGILQYTAAAGVVFHEHIKDERH